MVSSKELRAASDTVSDMPAELYIGGVLLQAHRALRSGRKAARLFYSAMDGERVNCPSAQISKAPLAWGAAFLRREVPEEVDRH